MTPRAPRVFHYCGREMSQDGRGAYPYDCIAKTKYPRAMVYTCHPCGAWTHEGHEAGGRIITWEIKGD